MIDNSNSDDFDITPSLFELKCLGTEFGWCEGYGAKYYSFKDRLLWLEHLQLFVQHTLSLSD